MNPAHEPARRRRLATLVLGGAALVAVTIGITVAVEHRLHRDGYDRGGEKPETAGEGDHHAEHAVEAAGHDHAARGEGKNEDGKIRLTPAMRENAKLGIRSASPGKVAVVLVLPGEVALNSERVAHVTPRVAGTVREVKKQLGDTVEKGDVLAVLDSRELADMQRDYLAAKERLDLAETNFERQEQLWNEKISAEKDFLAARQALAEARIEHRAASQKLSAGAGARGGAAGLQLTAPLDGTVIEKHAVVGEVLSDDRLAFVVADLSTLWVNVTVYAKDLPRVHIQQRAMVRAEGLPEAAAGQVTYIDRVVGEQTRSATARVLLDHPDPKWRPGLFVTAEIAVEEVEVPVVVADAAIQRVDGKEVVFVQEGEAFAARPITVGRRGIAPHGSRETVVEVLAGITAGQSYVAENSFVLKAELGKSEAGHEH